MKICVIGAILLLFGSGVCGTWKVGTVTNYSDLLLESAYFVKPHLTPIPYLNTLLQAEKLKPTPVSIIFNYTVSETANGHCIIKAAKGYQLRLDDNLTHHVKSGRTKAVVKKKSLGKTLGTKKSYGNLAQVFLEHVAVGDEQPKDVKYAILEYEQDGQVIDIMLSGSAGNYNIQLKAVSLAQN